MARRWIATGAEGVAAYELVQVEVSRPMADEVTVRIEAAGVNPADALPALLGAGGFPAGVGFEAAGVVTAVGPGVEDVQVGDSVIVQPVQGAWASELTVPVSSVTVRPAGLDVHEAAGLLAAGTTAAEALEVVRAQAGDRILVHGASGGVGLSIVQQAAALGVHVIGTASPAHADLVARFGATPVAYGPGLVERVRALGGRVDAVIDCAGTDEAVDASLELLDGTDRFLTIAAMRRAVADGLPYIGSTIAASAEYRARARRRLVDLAASGALRVPVARTFRLDDAREALDAVAGKHPGGKLVLIP